jgi:diguanylate cyclase
MAAPLDSMFGPLLWIGLSLAVTAVAAQLSFTWAELPSSAAGSAQWVRRLGAGASLGTGIWSAHGIGASIEPVAFLVGYRPGAELTLWLLSLCACTAAFAWADLRPSRLPRWALAACGLGSTVVALQMMGMFSVDWRPGIQWQPGSLLLAWMSCTAGTVLSFGLARSMGVQRLGAPALSKAAAGVVFAVAVVFAQHLVAVAANLPAQTGSSLAGQDLSGGGLTGVALLGSVGLLFALRRLLRASRERYPAQRPSGTLYLNDPLTGLPTRQLFDGVLAQAVQRADATRSRLALLLINLDGFKPINQSFGHVGGDVVLREVASRVRALSRPHMAARLAGDEFLSMLTEDPQVADASALAARLVAEIGRPYKINGREVSLTCSVGVAMYPEHGAMSTLIAHAQAAMSAAKAAGGASHAFFEHHMLKGPRDDAQLLRDLRVALERGQLELYYQPKIHAPTGEITGAEALMRWHHPQRGMVSPTVFIPLAERYGLINTLGHWVIDEACRQARAWRDKGLRMRVAINLSMHQLRRADLAQQIGAALQRHQINPDLITCEITESSAMEDTDVTTRVLGELDKVGVHISIDDFGTGHSSLSYLHKLPADELKIDRSFVLELETSEDARKVASAIVNLAKALNLKVVAEGVETEAQSAMLREFGCDQLQGYLFAKPMSAKALALWAMDDVGPRTMSFRSSLFKETVPAGCD